MADGSIDINAKPTETISVRDVFGIDTDMTVKGFADASDRVPLFDTTEIHARAAVKYALA